MKDKKTMLEEANEKKAGWSFIDDGSGVVITHMPARLKKKLAKEKIEKSMSKSKKDKEEKEEK